MFHNSAEVYDLIYESIKDYARESAAIHALIQERNPGARRLLDVGCGTGLHLAHLRSSYDVAGTDIDPGMLAVARRRLGEDVELVEADMADLALGGRFDAVICLFSAIGYMADTARLNQALSGMARHLAPGGVLIVDGWVLPEHWRDDGPTVSLEHGAEPGRVAVRVGRSWRDGRRTVFEAHHLVGTEEGVDHLIDRHDLVLFERGEYVAAFAAAGLRAEILPSPNSDRDRYVGVAAR